MKYRKLPTTVDAILWDGSVQAEQEIRRLKAANFYFMFLQDGVILIAAADGGRLKAEKGDYIISGVEGEVYPCKPDIFAQTYETV